MSSQSSCEGGMFFSVLYAFICMGVSVTAVFWILEASTSTSTSNSNSNSNSSSNSSSNSHSNSHSLTSNSSRGSKDDGDMSINNIRKEVIVSAGRSTNTSRSIGSNSSTSSSSRELRIYSYRNLWFICCGLLHCIFDYNLAFARVGSSFQCLLDYYSLGDSRFTIERLTSVENQDFNSAARAPLIISSMCMGPLALYLAYLSAKRAKSLYPWQLVYAVVEMYFVVCFFIHFFITKGFTPSMLANNDGVKVRMYDNLGPKLLAVGWNMATFFVCSHLTEESFSKFVR